MSELKDKIISNIKLIKERGFTLVDSDWGNDPTKCACALGCVLIANEYMIAEDPEDNAQVAAEILDVSESWITNFILGFDGDPAEVNNVYGEAWRLGVEIRNEMNPVCHADYINNLDPMVIEFVSAMESK